MAPLPSSPLSLPSPRLALPNVSTLDRWSSSARVPQSHHSKTLFEFSSITGIMRARNLLSSIARPPLAPRPAQHLAHGLRLHLILHLIPHLAHPQSALRRTHPKL